MLTAQEAREKTDNSSARIDALMETISKQIEEAAEGGKNYIYLDVALSTHGYLSILSIKDALKAETTETGAYATVYKRLRDLKYLVRTVDHASDISYFNSIYDLSMLERSPKDRFSIKVCW